MLDLILLKRDVYRHLLFNRGSGARMAVERVEDKQNPGQDEDQDDVKEARQRQGTEKEQVCFARLPLCWRLSAR